MRELSARVAYQYVVCGGQSSLQHVFNIAIAATHPSGTTLADFPWSVQLASMT